MGEDLTRATVRGVQWSYASALIIAGLQVIVGAVLARQLTPAEFGLVAMALVAIRFGQHFAQLGIGSAMVQKFQLTPEEIGAGFWASLAMGVLFSILFTVAAPVIGLVFRDEALIPVVRVLALSFALTGVSMSSLSLLRRNLRFKAIAAVEIISYVLGYGFIALALAFSGAGVWSLVTGNLVQSAFAAAGYYVASRHQIPFTRRRTDYTYLLSFGSKVSIVGFLEFLSTNVDTMVVGRYLGGAALGVYNRAYTVAYLPTYQVMQGMTRVLQPSISRMQRDIERMRRNYLNAMLLLAAAALPLSWGIAAASNEIVGVLLGSQWRDAVGPVTVMALAAPFSALTRLGEIVAEALGHLREKIVIRAVQLIAFVGLAWIGLPYGIVGLAGAFAIVEVGALAAYALLTSHLTGARIADIARNLIPGTSCAVAVSTYVYAVHRAAVFLGSSQGLALATQVIGAAIISIVGVLVIQRGRVWDTMVPLLAAAGVRGDNRIVRLASLIRRVTRQGVLDDN